MVVIETIATKFLTLTEVAVKIGRCEATVRNLINSGRLRAGRLRGRLMVHQDQVEAFLAARHERTEQAEQREQTAAVPA